MTSKAQTSLIAIVFFCSSGWVYSGSVLGADEAKPVAEVVPTDFVAPQIATEPGATEAPAATVAKPAAAPDSAAANGATAVAAAPPSLFQGEGEIPDTENADQVVKVSTLGDIDLHVKDLDITKVLQLLSIQAQRNIVASRNVSGSISADLYNVDFYAAMDGILQSNGFGYREKGNFIYVYTAQELKALQEAEKKTVSKVIRLNYLNTTDASSFVTPLLSSAGSISINVAPTKGFQPTISDGGDLSYAHASTMLIRDYPENVEEIVANIKELDVRPRQAMIEATILQAKLSEKNSFGVDLTIVANHAIKSFTTPGGAVEDLISGAVGPKNTAFTTGVGGVNPSAGLKVGIVESDFAAFIQAMDSVTDTTVLARPKLLVLNRQRADLLVGDRLGYLSTSATETSTTQTVEFLDVGTQLSLRPFISEDGFIRLEVKPSVSTGSTTLVGQGVVIPNQTTQELTTNVMVRSGQTVVLGGLFTESTTRTRRQVPGVGDLPLIGAAFKGQDDDVDRSEVIFLITPTIMKDEPLYAIADRTMHDAEQVMVGARESLLPWSRSKLTASYLRDAQTHLSAGDRAKAVWFVDMALTLEPTFIEARQLKAQITGSQTSPVQRSILQDAVNQVIKAKSSAAIFDETNPSAQADVPADATDAPAVANPEATSDANPQATAPAAGAGSTASVDEANWTDEPLDVPTDESQPPTVVPAVNPSTDEAPAATPDPVPAPSDDDQAAPAPAPDDDTPADSDDDAGAPTGTDDDNYSDD